MYTRSLCTHTGRMSVEEGGDEGKILVCSTIQSIHTLLLAREALAAAGLGVDRGVIAHNP